MKYFAILAGCMVVLAGCSSVEERQENVLDLLKKTEKTASGAVQDAMGGLSDIVQKGKTVTEGVGSVMEDAQRRIGQVQSGVDLLMQGKKLIELGVSTE